MASVSKYELTDGSELWEFRYRTPDGKSMRKRGFRTEQEAHKALRKIETAKDDGRYVVPSLGRTTVAHWWAIYIDGLVVKETTLSARRSHWSTRVGPYWADKRVDSIKVSDVKAWVAKMRRDGVGVPSIEAAVLVLRSVLAVALEDGAIPSNPAAKIKTGKRTLVRRGYLTHSQVECLAAHMGPQDATLVRFLAMTGLRFGEAAALTVDSFDTLRRRVTVDVATAEVDGKVVFDTPKDHQRRSVPYPKGLGLELARLMEGKLPKALVFTSPGGKVIRVSTWRPRVFARAVRACCESDASFPAHLTPHDLRHTAASLAHSAGASVKGVQRMLGHASAAMTLDVYSDLFDGDLDDVADRLDQARDRVVDTENDTLRAV